MFTPRHILIFALLSFLPGSGCSTGSRRAGPPGGQEQNSARAREWTRESLERVPEPPRLAPPPGSIPESTPLVPSRYVDTWIPLGRWARQHGYGTLRLSRAADANFALNTTNGTFLAMPGTLLASWDGLELHLGFEPQLIGNQIFLHTLDLKKNLEPLIHGPELQWRENPVIVVDPGHGGQNTGASNMASGLYEKEFTLDWARRLERLLTERGCQVYLTRTNDVDVALSNRVAFAQEHRADLFISLHFNSAAPNQEQAGLETYCLTPSGMPSTLTRGYEDDLTAIFPNNSFDEQNVQCAVLLHRALLPVVGIDRGVRRARFLGVLRGQSRAAVLIEAGFLSNPREARLIADPEYRQRLAEAMARALAPATSSPPVAGLKPGKKT